MHKPIDISALWPFLKNRVHNVRIDVALAIGYSHVNQIRCFLGNGIISLQILNQWHIMFQVNKLGMAIAQMSSFQQHKHHGKENHRYGVGKPTALLELMEVGDEK